MNCPKCGKESHFVRDRGFSDGSGMVHMCINPKCESHSLYFYPQTNHQKEKPMKTQKVRIVIYQDRKREYRWHMKRCGRIVAESGEGYKRSGSCVKSVTNLVGAITKFNYEFETPAK